MIRPTKRTSHFFCVLLKVWILLVVFITAVPLIFLFSRQEGDRDTRKVLHNIREQRPHFVFVLVDNLGWNDVGYHGSDLSTPTLNRLAQQGVKLENYYVQPSSTASRSQLLSGRYQIHTGLQHGDVDHGQPNGLPLSEVTLAQRLTDSGYSTHMVGKWHLGFYKKASLPTRRGFETFFGLLGDGDRQVKCGERRGRVPLGCGTHLYNNSRAVEKTQASDLGQLYLDRIHKVITQRDENKPLFLFVSLHGGLKHRRDPAPLYYGTLSSRRTYNEQLSQVESLVRNVTETLKNEGLWNDTVFFFSSAYGGDFYQGANNWPLQGGKDSYWEGGLRVPAFVVSPQLAIKITSGTECHELIHISDWCPTILNLAGVQGKGLTLDGFDQWPTLQFSEESPRKELLHNIDPLAQARYFEGSRSREEGFDTAMSAALRLGDWKLITGNPGISGWFPPPHINQGNSLQQFYPERLSKRVRLFNIAEDPTEHLEVSHEHPEIVRDMLGRLEAYHKHSTPVNFLDVDPHSNPELRGGIWQPWRG